jgi:ribosomal protein S27AE
MENTIENRPMHCGVCGAGPWHGRENSYTSREEIVVECQWTCGRCGALIANGVISRTPVETKNEK